MIAISGVSYGQSFKDYFSTFESAEYPRSYDNSSYQVPEYNQIDVDELFNRITPQNVQIVTGVFINNGEIYSIKLKIGTIPALDRLEVCGYWDGDRWNNCSASVSSIGSYGVPERIRMACTHETYISSIGTVYF